MSGPVHEQGIADRAGDAAAMPPQSTGPSPGSFSDLQAISGRDERDDPHAFTNFSSADVVERGPDEISPMTWIMVVVAGIVLGGVMTFIAAG